MKRRKGTRGEEPFQMAPMIDMVFLLLVFFMTVSTLAKDARPEVALPESGTAQVPDEAPPRIPLTVRVVSEPGAADYFLGSRALSRSDLKAALLKLPDPAGTTLLLRGPGDLPYRIWREVVEWCREAGIGEILFGAFEA